MSWRWSPQGQLATEASELINEGRHEEALALLQQALEFDRSDKVVLTYLGRVLTEMGRYQESKRHLREAVDIDEDFSHAWNELGYLMKAMGEFEKAAFCFEQSARIDPNVYVFTELANVQLVFDPRKAAENADRALSLDPTWEEAQTVRAAAQRAIDNPDEE